ncbi:MAG TPA: hypothetical protein VMU55_02570, partial [Solirubrobacteraceae bacterium]|nr:hypothetical protein [Solirubrobacteraceae bacterium]
MDALIILAFNELQMEIERIEKAQYEIKLRFLLASLELVDPLARHARTVSQLGLAVAQRQPPPTRHRRQVSYRVDVRSRHS